MQSTNELSFKTASCATNAKAFIVGFELDNTEELVDSDAICDGRRLGYDIAVAYITNLKYKNLFCKEEIFQSTITSEGCSETNKLVVQPTLSHVGIDPHNEMAKFIFGMTSDSTQINSQKHEQILLNEISYALFCGLSHVIISGPSSLATVFSHARRIYVALMKFPTIHIILRLEMRNYDDVISQHVDEFRNWIIWNNIRTVCAYSSRLSLALDIPKILPSTSLISRWYSEPVSTLFIPMDRFIKNAKGFPVLPIATQKLLYKFFTLNPYVIISQSTRADLSASADYLIYIRHLYKKQPALSAIEEFGRGYEDYLQNPLQPLSDNLVRQTYAVFEQDPVKYNQYERAIHAAVQERDGISKSTQMVIAVVGAGRGPLVDRVLKVVSVLSIDARIIAVEKNASAFAYLQQRAVSDWNNRVEILNIDMRTERFAVDDSNTGQIDIMVSELLGSFGDNELSPECLDGAQQSLKPDGIMIPQSYLSFFSPISVPKLHTTLNSYNNQDFWHRPYVTFLRSCDLLSPNIHTAWEFKHPRTHQSSNEAFASKTFKVPNQSVMHGFAGWFEACLYANIRISTHPQRLKETECEDMVSWFPIWFPIRDPLPISADSEIGISIWRKTDKFKVWYEWAVELFCVTSLPGGMQKERTVLSCTPIHNFMGKHYAMNLY
ncbi:PRMT5 arginine-N-methyltransferase-domain-containing protein [Lipomyces oligophaga]|uniref:PRMT5 arginine-N-methyltransferase-domain-containing protein n=1 Tax=Lipomyces oligophaga TaxID=45792 RepID=UPI0034CD8464